MGRFTRSRIARVAGWVHTCVMTTTQANTAAEQIFAHVAAGRTVFTTLAGNGWSIAGPAKDVLIGAAVTVTKANGETDTVIPRSVVAHNTVRGVEYIIAKFTKTTPHVADTAGDAQNVSSALYGMGQRCKGDGFTQYQSPTTGAYSVQIWDES